jgi:hypothetical protein
VGKLRLLLMEISTQAIRHTTVEYTDVEGYQLQTKELLEQQR